MSGISQSPLRIGVAGLGRAFTLMGQTFANDSRVRLVDAFDPNELARKQFERDFSVACSGDFSTLCTNPQVDVIYIATPHQLHVAHAQQALAAGKHILVEKPMALDVAGCTAMIEAADAAKRVLLVGHSHSFNTPVLKTQRRIASGAWGAVKMIQAFNYTDFLYRPRRPEELDASQGGGVIYSQAAHQIDIVRLLGGGLVSQVFAQTSAWDASRGFKGTAVEGAYMAQLRFESGVTAQLCYSGYAHFDSDVWMGERGELGASTQGRQFATARQRLMGLSRAEEAQLKSLRAYGSATAPNPNAAQEQQSHQHFGPLIISCEHASLRPTPLGLHVDSDVGTAFEPWQPPDWPRKEVVDELCMALVEGKPTLHQGRWARATVAVQSAIIESSRLHAVIQPAYQVAV